MNFNKKLLFLTLLGVNLTELKNISAINFNNFLNNKNTVPALVATCAGTSLLAFYNYYKNRQLSKDLEYLKSGNIQKENDQKMLIEIGQYIDSVNQNFESEIILAKSKNLYQEEYIERWIDIAKQKRSLINSVNLTFSAITNYKKELELRILDWEKKNSEFTYILKGKDLFKELSSLEKLFKDISQTLKSQNNFIDLCLLIEKNSFADYLREFELSKLYFGQNYIIELDKIIRSKIDANNSFPYLVYAAKLKNNIENLNNILEKLKNNKLFVFQEQVITKAKEQSMALCNLLETVVSINFYQQEQIRKPEFDKQQKLLAAELKEREEKILREKQKIEKKLLAEKNKEQALANESAKIERDRQTLYIQERAVLVEYEKLKNGQILKEELARELSKNENKIKSEIEKAKQDIKKELEIKEQELANIKSQLQLLNQQKYHAESMLDKVHRNIAVCKQYIINLQNKLATPPINPESVDGLADYLNNLKYISNNAINSI